MVTGNDTLQDRISVAGTARLDRAFARCEPVEQELENWLLQVVGKIHVAISRRIPVGFEDETGFHLGVQPVWVEDRMDWERAGIFAGDEHF